MFTRTIKAAVFSAALLSCCIAAQAQSKSSEADNILQLNEKTGAYEYEEVFPFDSTALTQEQAYQNAKNYILSTLKTGDNNIVSDDKTFSQLINNGNLLLKPMTGFGYAIATSSVDFKLKMNFKSGRYRILIDNVVYHAIYTTANGSMPITQSYSEIRGNKAGRKFKENVDETLTAFIIGLNRATKNKTAPADNNW